MKFLCILSLSLLGFNSQAQAFHFDQTYTVLVKTTDESPAHWYFEILNDVLLDTTLRWKTSFDSWLPPQWVITFDDQNTFYNPIEDGDSADFTLYTMPIVPQKLIIGALLNNTPGNASVYFDVYDPADPSYVVTIQYRFVVSMGSGTWGISAADDHESWFTHVGHHFHFSEECLGKEIVVFDSAGKRIYGEMVSSSTIDLPNFVDAGVYYITMLTENRYYSTRIVLN